jgi:hypothetical protein
LKRNLGGRERSRVGEKKKVKIIKCGERGSNTRPSDLQSDALPTELSPLVDGNETFIYVFSEVYITYPLPFFHCHSGANTPFSLLTISLSLSLFFLTLLIVPFYTVTDFLQPTAYCRTAHASR